MPKEAEGGAIGSAQLKSYTYWLTFVVGGEAVGFVYYDINQGGPHFLSTAIGIGNSNWLWVSVVIALFINSMNASIIANIYQEFTGLSYVQDRLGFAKAGASDINFWSTFLAFVGTIYAFESFVPAGALGIFRPFVVLLVFYVVARILLGVGAHLVFSTLYRSPTRTIIGSGGLHCQHNYLPNRRCPRLTYHNSQWCRWHKILHEFRDDNKRMGGWIAHSHMFGAGINFTLAITALWFFSRSADIIWIPLIFFTIGWGCMLFADGMIALDYPLSQFAAWAKLLMIGMILAIIGGMATIVYALLQPQAVLPIVSLLAGQSFSWLALYGPALLVLIVTLLMISPLRLLVGRILFFHPKYLSLVLWFLASGVVGLAFRPVLEKLNPFNLYSPDAFNKFGGMLFGNRFWEAVLGDNVWWPLGIAYFVGFNVCEFINLGIRRRQLDTVDFKRTVWPSYPVCGLTPLLTLFASRYLLSWIGITGAVPFVLLAVVLCIPLCIFGTRIVLLLNGRTG